MKFQIEYTDTFSGEANYSWVRRATIDVPKNAPDSLVVCRAKAALGLSGVRCRRDDMGETIVLRPYGMCTVVFINHVEG